jgi:hypothetical protein
LVDDAVASAWHEGTRPAGATAEAAPAAPATAPGERSADEQKKEKTP